MTIRTHAHCHLLLLSHTFSSLGGPRPTSSQCLAHSKLSRARPTIHKWCRQIGPNRSCWCRLRWHEVPRIAFEGTSRYPIRCRHRWTSTASGYTTLDYTNKAKHTTDLHHSVRRLTLSLAAFELEHLASFMRRKPLVSIRSPNVLPRKGNSGCPLCLFNLGLLRIENRTSTA